MIETGMPDVQDQDDVALLTGDEGDLIHVQDEIKNRVAWIKFCIRGTFFLFLHLYLSDVYTAETYRDTDGFLGVFSPVPSTMGIQRVPDTIPN